MHRYRTIGTIGDTDYHSSQHAHQCALAIKLGQIVETTDMMIADENLRHAPTTTSRHHFLALLRIYQCDAASRVNSMLV